MPRLRRAEYTGCCGGFVACCLYVATLCPAGALDHADNTTTSSYGDRLVRILVAYQKHDPFYPWKSSTPATRQGYGIQIDSEYILTTEHLVRNATLVESQRLRSADKIPLTVQLRDLQLNLALLRRPAVPVANPPKMIRIDEDIRINDRTTIIQMDSVRDLQEGPAIVKQSRVSDLGNSPHRLLLYNLLCSLNVTGEGAPVIGENGLVGIVAGFNQRSRIASVIAAPFIRRFLDDALSPPYRGVATAGFSWNALVDPVKRRYLKLDEDTRGGILVVGTLPFSGAADTLKSMDVILDWDGHPIDKLGFYKDPKLGRLELSHLIKGHRRPGDIVPVRVLRDGKVRTMQLALSGDLDRVLLVPENVTGRRAEYLVAGGFILRELDVNFLRSHGEDWRAKVDPRLLNFYMNGRYAQDDPQDRIVIVSSVLPDAINIGYQKFHSAVVTRANGRDIRNLADVFAAKDKDGTIHRLSLHGVGFDLVLDRDTLEEAEARLADNYRVSPLEFRRSKNLR